MSEYVFILGAGSSVCGGVPIMDNFIEKAEDLRRANKIENMEAYKIMENAIGELHKLYYKANIKIRNIENVLDIFEMAKITKNFFGFSKEQINEISSYYRQYICDVIEKTAYIIQRDTGNFSPNDTHLRFVDLLDKLLSAKKKNSISLITFNYDTLIEYALKYKGINYYYRFPDEKNENENETKFVSLLKLHGSLNWKRCNNRECNKISEINAVEMVNTEDKYKKNLILSRSTNKCPACKNDLHLNAEIIPPTWNKSGQYEYIEPIWQAAAQELKEAEYICIIGYSLPDSDVFFKYFYALGSYSSKAIRKFIVINPDKNTEVNFRKMIGQSVADCFEFKPLTFEKYFEEQISKKSTVSTL